MLTKYKCAICGQWFESERENMQLVKEYVENFPNDKIEDATTICHCCYVAFMSELKKANQPSNN
jgi:hypothetical protein